MTPKQGTKYSLEHRRQMSLASQTSPAAHAHRRRLHRNLQGKLPLKATAASLAVKRLHRMGLTRKQAPELFEEYMAHFVAMLTAGSDS